MVKLFLDPGHGGNDSGAVGNGLLEKKLTLQIARRIESILNNEYENVTVRKSRTGDQTVSLSARTNDANSWGADYYLSIHINAGGGTGFESFVYSYRSNRSKNNQQAIHGEVMKQIDIRDRGMKEANFHVLRESKMPALLTENGFIDNASDAQKLKSSTFIENIARGHVAGLARALGLKRKGIPTQPPSNPVNPNVLYKVQIGAYRNRSNAEAQQQKARQAGFDVYIVSEDNLFKVQIGAFANQENANRLAERARKAGFAVYIARQ